MTTTFFLVRHAAHDNVGGFLAGRLPGIVLGEAGLAQAKRLAQRMQRESFAAVHTSPRERTQQTASVIAAAANIERIETARELDEIDFGNWSGKTFDVLNQDAHWRRWNEVRSLTRTPGGETMLDVQHRVTGLIERLAQAYRGKGVVLVSHADVIKAAAMHVLGLAVDAWPRFDVGPGSITTLVTGEWGAKLLNLNEIVP